MSKISLNMPIFSTFSAVSPRTVCGGGKRLWQFLFFSALLLLPLSAKCDEAPRFVPVLTVYQASPEEGSSLLRPEGVFCRDTVIVIADTGHGQLVRYTLEKGNLSVGQIIALPKDSHPIQVKLNSTGEIFFLDGRLRQVVHLDPAGKSIGRVAPGEIPGAGSMVIRAFTIDSADNLYMVDLFGQQLVIVDAGMHYTRSIPLPEKNQTISDVAVDSSGKIYLLDSISGTIFTAGANSDEFTVLTDNLKDFATFPTGLTPDGKGDLFVVDSHGNGVVILGTNGSYLGRQLTMGWKAGLLYYPTQLCLTSGDEAVIADRGNNRVQIFKVNYPSSQ